MMSQQAEAARYTADAARHIKEVSNQCLPLCLENSPCLHFITKADRFLSYSKEITINMNICSLYIPVCQMTELARSQIAGALVVAPVAADSSMLDRREEQESSYTKQQQDQADSDR